MTVQRYNCHVGLYTYGMKKEDKGMWVRYDDIKRVREAEATLRENYARTIVQQKDQIDTLKGKLDKIESILDCGYYESSKVALIKDIFLDNSQEV